MNSSAWLPDSSVSLCEGGWLWMATLKIVHLIPKGSLETRALSPFTPSQRLWENLESHFDGKASTVRAASPELLWTRKT